MPATKDEIATTFLELAFRYGYRRTAVEDVARELHISKKTVYEHFASKAAPQSSLRRQFPRTYEWAKCQKPTGSTWSMQTTSPMAPASRMPFRSRVYGV